MNHLLKTVLLLTILPLLSIKAQDTPQDIITFDVGSFSITLLSEGQQQGNTGILIGATEEMMKQTVPEGTFPNAMNAFLVETGDKTILFDTGLGRKLFGNLQASGKTATDIDAIIITHMHGDHIGGLLRDKEKNFPTADLYIPKPEHDYWMSDAAMQQVPENRRGSFTNARNVIDAYKDKLHTFTPGETGRIHELFPGIRSIAAYGHTPGHTGYLLESDGSKLFIWGDLAHAMAIQMPFPEVAVTYDVDPVQAVKTRQQILQYLSENNIPFAGMHIPYPGVGTIRKNPSGGYNFKLTCDCEGR